MSKDEILTKLKATRSEDEWDNLCDEVKEYTKDLPPEQRSGQYPSWWFKEVIASGLIYLAQYNWGKK